MDAETQAFFKSHTESGASYVVAVYVFDDEGGHVLGLFSTLENAHAWADTFEGEPRITSCLFSPYVVDVPEFGNVAVKQRQ